MGEVRGENNALGTLESFLGVFCRLRPPLSHVFFLSSNPGTDALTRRTTTQFSTFTHFLCGICQTKRFL